MSKDKLNGTTVLVLGASSFVGQHVTKKLHEKNAIVQKHSKKDCDLTDPNETRRYIKDVNPEMILNLSGVNGGILHNRTYPADIFWANTQLNLNVIKTAQEIGVQKLISIATSCAYPDNLLLLKEGMLFDGPCNSSIACHGYAKRNVVAYSEFVRNQYAFPAYALIVTNLFGPHDTFGPRGKVVSNLIKKFVEAKQNGLKTVESWGKGLARRDLLYVEDAAGYIVDALEKLDHDHILNIGSGQDITIFNLTTLIASLVEYAGEITWNGQDEGQLKKLLDITKMKEVLTYRPQYTLEEGLKKTIDWYIKNKTEADLKP